MEIVIYLECPNTEVLGVFGENVHLLTHGFIDNDSDTSEDFECILITSEKEYLKQWKAWLKGKQDYCERYNHYCGVLGYVHPINPELLGTQKITKWNEEKEDMEVIEVNVYTADKFTSPPDFEHG